jgi:hypothetical protein
MVLRSSMVMFSTDAESFVATCETVSLTTSFNWEKLMDEPKMYKGCLFHLRGPHSLSRPPMSADRGSVPCNKLSHQNTERAQFLDLFSFSSSVAMQDMHAPVSLSEIKRLSHFLLMNNAVSAAKCLMAQAGRDHSTREFGEQWNRPGVLV